jgi:hypothetical protein
MIATLFVVLTFSLLYWFPIRRWMNRWGATPSELARVNEALERIRRRDVEMGLVLES